VFEQVGHHVHVEVDAAATESARFGKCIPRIFSAHDAMNKVANRYLHV
jgi:hypothetical protein